MGSLGLLNDTADVEALDDYLNQFPFLDKIVLEGRTTADIESIMNSLVFVKDRVIQRSYKDAAAEARRAKTAGSLAGDEKLRLPLSPFWYDEEFQVDEDGTRVALDVSVLLTTYCATSCSHELLFHSVNFGLPVVVLNWGTGVKHIGSVFDDKVNVNASMPHLLVVTISYDLIQSR